MVLVSVFDCGGYIRYKGEDGFRQTVGELRDCRGDRRVSKWLVTALGRSVGRNDNSGNRKSNKRSNRKRGWLVYYIQCRISEYGGNVDAAPYQLYDQLGLEYGAGVVWSVDRRRDIQGCPSVFGVRMAGWSMDAYDLTTPL